MTTPGIDRKGSTVIIPETGGDMTRCRTVAHPAGRIMPGQPRLCRDQQQESGGMATKHSELPLAARRWSRPRPGKPASANATTGSLPDEAEQRAIVAIGHSLRTAIWHRLMNDLDYHELRLDHFDESHSGHAPHHQTSQCTRPHGPLRPHPSDRSGKLKALTIQFGYAMNALNRR